MSSDLSPLQALKKPKYIEISSDWYFMIVLINWLVARKETFFRPGIHSIKETPKKNKFVYGWNTSLLEWEDKVESQEHWGEWEGRKNMQILK